MFNVLCLMFEQQYTELAVAVDLIAEEMIRHLVAGQGTVIRAARSVFPAVEAANDQPTADLLTQRMGVHEKIA